MTYKISSKKFEHPLLKPILQKLTEYFSEMNIQFYVIGATARDIIMQLNNERSSRATHDLDIAIAISDWNEYKKVEEGIVAIDGFTKDQHQKQRFLYQGTFYLDIVPYGDVLNQDDKIFWPPDESIAMSILGFSEVNNTTQQISIDETFTINVASLDGIFLLKVSAWAERHLEGNKDADDMAFIINNYLSINEDKALEDHYDLYADDDFDTRTAGSRLLGRHLTTLFGDSKATKDKFSDILQTEINKEEESILINQILETHKSLKYDTTYECLINILKGLDD